MIKDRKYGIISLGIMDITMAISLYCIAIESLLMGAIYFVCGILAIALTIVSFCSKCCAKDKCSHVYPGIITRYFADKRGAKYTKADYFYTGLALAFIILFPQYWLWQKPGIFITYWLLTSVALLMINKRVCTNCANTKCAMCKHVSP